MNSTMFSSTDLLPEYQQQPFMDPYYNNWATAAPPHQHQHHLQHQVQKSTTTCSSSSSSTSSNNNTPVAAAAPLLIGADMAPIQTTPSQHAEPAQLLTPPLTASAADASVYGWPTATSATNTSSTAASAPAMACVSSDMVTYVTPQSRPDQQQQQQQQQGQHFVVSSGIMTPETDPEFNVAQFPKDVVSPSISISCISPVADAAMVPQQPQQMLPLPQPLPQQQQQHHHYQQQQQQQQQQHHQNQQHLQQHQHHPHGLYYTFPTPTDASKLLHSQPMYSSPAPPPPSIQYITTQPFAQPVGLQEPLMHAGPTVTTAAPQPPLLLVSPVNVPQLGPIPIAQPQQLQPAAQFHPRARAPIMTTAPVVATPTSTSTTTTTTITTPPIVPCIEDLQQTKMVKLSRMTASRIEMIKKLAEQKGIQPQIVESVLLLYTPAGREKYFKYLQIDDDMSRLDGEDIYIKITVNGGGTNAAPTPMEDEVQKQRVAAAAAAAKQAVLAQNAAQILYGSPSQAAAAANAAAAAAVSAAAAASASGSSKKKSRKNRRDYVKRPLNSFMLYRKSQTQSAMAYAVHSKLKLNHQNISQIVGLMWQTESKEVKDKFAYFAGREKEIHKVLHPDYKFCPQKKKKKLENDEVY